MSRSPGFWVYLAFRIQVRSYDLQFHFDGFDEDGGPQGTQCKVLHGHTWQACRLQCRFWSPHCPSTFTGGPRQGRSCLARYGPSRYPRTWRVGGGAGPAHHHQARRGSSCAWYSDGCSRSCAWHTAGSGSPHRAPDTPQCCRPGTGSWALSTGGLHRLGWGRHRETQ